MLYWKFEVNKYRNGCRDGLKRDGMLSESDVWVGEDGVIGAVRQSTVKSRPECAPGQQEEYYARKIRTGRNSSAGS